MNGQNESQEITLFHHSYGLIEVNLSGTLIFLYKRWGKVLKLWDWLNCFESWTPLKSHSKESYFEKISRKTVRTHSDTGSHTSEFAYCGRLNYGLPKDVLVLISRICECCFIIYMRKRHCKCNQVEDLEMEILSWWAWYKGPYKRVTGGIRVREKAKW